MKRRIKESKNIFPCTVYTENQDYDEVYYYLDTPEYGLSWRYFDDVEQEDIENYKYIIKNIADLRKAIDDLEEDFIHGYGNSYFKLSENYMEDLLNRGKTLVRVKKEHKERVYIIRVKPAQNVELATVKESIEDNTETGVFVVTDFSDDSYKNPKVKRIKIADGVTSIKEDAFFNCKNLTEVIIPDSVTSIENDAFENCKNLKTIHYAGTRDQWNAIEKAFDWIADTREIMIDYNYQESSTFDESSVELALAESFEKTIKSLQKEGLFENVSSFDLNFTGKGINIKLNEGTYEWGANFGHNIDDDIEDNEDADYYTARPDKLFKSEEAAIRACEKYCDANPSDYCEVLHYHADSGWQVSEAYDGFYD